MWRDQAAVVACRGKHVRRVGPLKRTTRQSVLRGVPVARQHNKSGASQRASAERAALTQKLFC